MGVLDKAQSFIFGGNTGTPTVESLKKRREIADLLAAQAMGTGGEYKNWGDGVGMIAKAIGARMMDKSVGRHEDTARQSAMDQFMKIRTGLGDEGISVSDFQGLNDLTENDYAPSGIQAVAKSLMRRKILPDGVPAFANGGIAPGGMAMVGERGPELVNLPRGARVTSTEELMRMAQLLGGGAGTDALMGQAGGDRFGAPQQPPPDMNALQQQGQGLPPLAAPSWIDGMNQQMGGPGARLAGTGNGPEQLYQVAQADTGTQSDAGGTSMKLTEQQAKNLNFWNRMDGTEEKLDRFTPELMDRGEQFKDWVPLIGNSLVSEGYQRGRGAAGEWIVGILRPDTGAQVTDTEWDIYAPIYIPQPGDHPGEIADKKERRARAVAGLKKGLGLAEVLADEMKADRAKAKAAAPAAAAPAAGSDPSTWTLEQLREFAK